MKNAFKIGFFALAVTLVVSACGSKQAEAPAADTAAAAVDTAAVDTAAADTAAADTAAKEAAPAHH